MTFGAIVVLGRGINEDGSLPPDPVWRVRRGIELFQKGIAPYILMSGAYSYHFAKVPPRSESAAMKQLAVERFGVPAERVLEEDQSKDTLGNALYVKARAKQEGWESLVVVASDEHMDRVRYVFAKVFGPRYPIAFEESERVLDNHEYVKQLDREQRSTQVISQWLDSVEAGNHQAIWRVLREKHPAYSDFVISPEPAFGLDLFPNYP